VSDQEIIIEKEVKTPSKVQDYVMLLKLRLAFLVVLSAVSGYFFAVDNFNLIQFIYLIIGGFLITGSSNGFNQIIERDIDIKMKRTAIRPLPAGRMSVKEALLVSILSGIIGSIMLFKLHIYAGALGILALFLYVAVYTPMKRVSPWAVFVGAFPGAIPPMLGVIAVTGDFDEMVGIMFLVQFIWQFPHFWAIAWVSDDDYKLGGFSLLPSKGRKNRASSIWILVSTFIMIPAGVLPYIFGHTGMISLIVGVLAGLWFFYYAIKFYPTMDDKMARKLMFASFLYLPIIQFLYVFNQI
jgi:protoheme IX farnesyltransferase